MSTSTTPTFRIETTQNGGYQTPMVWDCKRYGRPTKDRLEAFVKSYHKSLEPGEVNAHIGTTGRLNSAKVVRQSNDAVVAEWAAPAFEII